MCMKLGELRQAMAGLASRFDAALLGPAQARAAMSEAAAIEHMAAVLKAMAADRLAESEAWRGEGDRSAAHHLARTTGTPVSQAASELEMAKRLKHRPKTEAAARAGTLSPQQAAAIADAAEADPDAEDDLLALAAKASLQELREEAARRKAAATDLDERHRRIHNERRVRDWTDGEGGWNLSARGTPEDGAKIMAALRTVADGLFKAARGEGRREPPEAYAFDALVQLVTGGEGAGVARGRTKVLVRVDFEALLRGIVADGEVCEIAGFGPVPVSVVEALLAQGDTFLAAVITKGVAVTGVAHLGRRPTAAQRSALEWLYPTCAVEGCSALARQIDHRVDWAKTHITLLDLLDGYCGHHHDLKTYDGWALVEGVGKRAFVPPSDPRHPRNAANHERPPPETE
jgi:uncharacterized protein DUF222